MVFINAVINPIFKMMFVPSFMMQPGPRIPTFFLFSRIRTAVSLKIQHSCPEFLRSIFGQVMHQPLPVKSHFKTALHNDPLMLCNCPEMVPSVFQSIHYHTHASCFFHNGKRVLTAHARQHSLRILYFIRKYNLTFFKPRLFHKIH